MLRRCAADSPKKNLSNSLRVNPLPVVIGTTQSMNEEIKPLVIKYITGNADASEQEYVRQWIGESQDNMDDYISLRETWQDALHHPDHRVFQTDKAFERLRERLSAGAP